MYSGLINGHQVNRMAENNAKELADILNQEEDDKDWKYVAAPMGGAWVVQIYVAGEYLATM